MQSADRGNALGDHPIHGGAGWVSVFRLGFFLAAVCVMSFALLLRPVYADVTEVLWGLGEQIMEYPGAPHEGVRQLQLNGVGVSFRTQTVDAPLADVLAHYETLCGTQDAGLADQLTSLLKVHLAAPPSPGVLRAITTQTARNDRTGYVACLDMGDAPQDISALVERILRFSQTGDLREVGDLRYIFARRVESSSGEKTFLLTMWSDSAINLYRMLTRASADAPGRDPVGVPRPTGSQRILSAWETRQPNGIFVYHVVAKSAQDLELFYRSALPRNGWVIIERNPSESVEVDGIHMLSAEKNNRLVTVLYRSGEASRTLLTILASEPSS
jgi:hypothetical protein